MRVVLLSDENIMQDVHEEVDRLWRENLGDVDQMNINRIIGKEEEPKRIIVDVTNLLKPTSFDFKLSKVTGIYISTLLYKESPIMVLIIDGLEFLAIYEEKQYEKLITYLNK